MSKYVTKKLLLGLVTIFFSFTFTFFLIRFAPGDPIKILAGRENPNPEQIAYAKNLYGLDQPLHIQFITYLMNVLRGDFGYSFRNNQSVLGIIATKVRPTLLLTVFSSTLSALIGTSLGIAVAQKSDSRFDRFILRLSYLIDAIPTFWLGLILIMIFSSTLGWFPTAGMQDIRNRYTGLRGVLDLAHHMVLPVLTLVIVQVPIYMRVARSSILNVKSADYILTFRATGMKESKIFYKYVMKNAIVPVLTLFGMSLAFTISGVALIEIIFAWPGMGRLIMDSIQARDYMVLNGVYLLISVSVIIFMILIDVVQAAIDPRIRLR